MGMSNAINEVIAIRSTFDGDTVQFWSDGAITIGHPMNNRLVARNLPRMAVWAIAGDVSLYDAAEVKALIKAARKAADMHQREPWRVRDNDVVRVMRCYAPRGA